MSLILCFIIDDSGVKAQPSGSTSTYSKARYRVLNLARHPRGDSALWVAQYCAKDSASPEAELRLCPVLLLFRYGTGGPDPSSSLCLHYVYLW